MSNRDAVIAALEVAVRELNASYHAMGNGPGETPAGWIQILDAARHARAALKIVSGTAGTLMDRWPG